MPLIYSEAVINSKLLVNYFKDKCKDFVPPYKTDCIPINQKRLEINRKVTSFLTEVTRLVTEGKCDLSTFKKEILNIKKPEMVHLEIFWYLEVYDFLTLDEIIQHHEENNNEDIIGHIGASIYNGILMLQTRHSSLREKLLSSYLKTIFSSKEHVIENSNICLRDTLLKLISFNLVEFYKLEASEKSLFSNALNVSFLIELFKKAELDFSSVSYILIFIVISLLEGSTQMLKSVILQQNLKSNMKEHNIYTLLKLISKHIDSNCLLNEFHNLLLDQFKKINWSNALPLLTFIGENHPDGWKKIRNICDSVLKHSFQLLDSKLLFYAFIIARQGCAERSKGAFPNYLHWFGSAFSSKSSTPISSKEICKFFFNFLSELIPYDTAQYLKVHVNRVPLVPAECECIIADYTTLVNARLNDLNASTELGICENNTEQSAAVFDVENVIKHFTETNTIMNSVFQSAMFNKRYFEKKFLVELLSKFDGKNSPRHKIITKLNSLGKISKSAYKKYQTLEKNSGSK